MVEIIDRLTDELDVLPNWVRGAASAALIGSLFMAVLVMCPLFITASIVRSRTSKKEQRNESRTGW